MTATVVEVGPAQVRGPVATTDELASAALEFIDDGLALVGDQPVAVDELWSDLLKSAIADPVEQVVLVCPTWWATARVERVCAAAHALAVDIIAVQRVDALRAASSAPSSTVVEIGPDVVVLALMGEPVVAVARSGDPEKDAKAVVAELGIPASVVVDAPAGVEGAIALGAAIGERLRARGAAVSIADQRSVRRGAATMCPPEPAETPHVAPRRKIRRGGREVAVLAGAVLSIATVCVTIAGRPDTAVALPVVPMTLLVEGRVGVKIPALWTVRRVTAGPGSARVQVVSPSDEHTAVHITQSPVAPGGTLAQTAEALRQALDEEPSGAFLDFDPDDRMVDKPVVAYRERRTGHDIRWSVLVDGSVRIGIGCQSAPGRDEQVRYACDEAVRSAHAVF